MELLNKDDFKELIKNDLVLVDFYANWCGPCKMLSPILEAKDIKKIKIDVDKFPEIAQNFGVMSIPTLILFKDGIQVDKNIGFISSDELDEFINRNR